MIVAHDFFKRVSRMAKIIFLKCKNKACGYAKNWIKAKNCEQCGYDFKLGRMPRKRRENSEVDEVATEEEEDVFVPPPPPTTHKECPECHFSNWHRAPTCERCEYNFRTGESKKQQAVREAKETGAPVPEVDEEKRGKLGIYPSFLRIKHEDWMDDFKGPWEAKVIIKDGKIVAHGEGDTHALREWAGKFQRNVHKLAAEAGLDEAVYPGVVAIYAECYTKNPLLKAALPQLLQWFDTHSAVSQWRYDKTNSTWLRGESLTSAEAGNVWRGVLASIDQNVSVDCVCRRKDGGEFIYTSMMPPAKAKEYYAGMTKEGMAYHWANNGKILFLLPAFATEQEQSIWLYNRCIYPDTPLAAPTPPAKKRKTKAS
jgi:hypothetical protein